MNSVIIDLKNYQIVKNHIKQCKKFGYVLFVLQYLYSQSSITY
jgi:hypothetical protein